MTDSNPNLAYAMRQIKRIDNKEAKDFLDNHGDKFKTGALLIIINTIIDHEKKLDQLSVYDVDEIQCINDCIAAYIDALNTIVDHQLGD